MESPYPKTVALITFLVLYLLLPGIYSYCEAKVSLRRSAVVIAVEKVSPAVVNISTQVKEQVHSLFPFSGSDFFRDFFPDLFPREYTRTSLGSGIIIDGARGFIVTNHHVVVRAAEIKVITSSEDEYQAKILGSDPRSDLAVLQIEVRKRLPEIEMGNSDDLMIGEMVIAIGNPFGLSHTVTTGVVSALDRSVRAKNRIYRHFIQTDASINPGNSGGPLLNIEGELIGVNSAIYQKAQGIGFAIPVNKAKRIVKELLKAGEVRFPWLGLEIQELSHELKTYFNLSEGSGGVLINNVIQKGPAHRAGLKRGDILLKFEGTPIFSLSDYHGALAEFTPSDPVRVTVFRKGKEMSFFIQPSIFPLDLVLELVYRRLGIKVDEMKENVLKKYGLREGVAIEEVRQGSEAKQAGLRPGDLILKINHITVNNLDEFKKAISRYHHLPSLTMLVQRGSYGYSLILPF